MRKQRKEKVNSLLAAQFYSLTKVMHYALYKFILSLAGPFTNTHKIQASTKYKFSIQSQKTLEFHLFTQSTKYMVKLSHKVLYSKSS